MTRFLARIPFSQQDRAVKVGIYLASMATMLTLFPAIGFFQTEETTGALWWSETREIPLSERLPFLGFGVGFLAVAVVGWLAVLNLLLLRGRMRKYLPIVTDMTTGAIDIARLASITNASQARVTADVQAMIDSGMVDDLYIDHGAAKIVDRRFVPKAIHRAVVTCSGCRATNDVIVGQPARCEYCRQPLAVERP